MRRWTEPEVTAPDAPEAADQDRVTTPSTDSMHCAGVKSANSSIGAEGSGGYISGGYMSGSQHANPNSAVK